MGDFFVYILKSAACLVVFYLFFRLLLNRDTFHRFNRIAVLCILVLSVIVPFCNIHMDTQTQVNQAVVEFHQLFVEPDNVATVTQSDNSLTWIHGVLIVYLAGIIFFLFRNVYFLLCMRRLLQQGRAEKPDSGVKLVVHNKVISPFSWMNYIIVSENDLRENGKEIMAHEMAHVRKLHSIDILLADICIVFQWFNPAIWLIKQELQNIHEYEADEYVLKEGIDAKHYQLLLIKKAVGKRLYSMANSLNHSKLKKRITMMSKQKSSPWARLKYLYVLPVTVVAITAFARPEISGQLNKIAEVKVSDFSGMAKVSDAAKSNSLVNDAVYGSVLTDIPIKKDEAKDANIVVKGNAMNIVSDNDGSLALLVSGDAVLETSSGEGESMSMSADTMKLYLSESRSALSLDTKKVTSKRVGGIVKDASGNPVESAAIVVIGTKIGTITDSEGKFSLEVPDDATLSISMIGMNKATVKVNNSDYLTITLTSQGSGKNVIIASGDSAGNTKYAVVSSKRPLVVIDGKVSPDGISALDPNEIASLKVLQKEEATKQYGADGENGAVLITTKNKDK
ncbi:hypothetical protein FACS1894169_10760 [Bacteroidia bacterium]|nr:hypothetical protein FACS1894169_10760 [Bacteroidia bacterium]